ncbi:2733_t:CDS:1, partial [Dentiscutata heterogama]
MSTMPYAITDSSEEDVQRTLQKTEKLIQPNNLRSKKRKLAPVHEYLDELSDDLETFKL